MTGSPSVVGSGKSMILFPSMLTFSSTNSKSEAYPNSNDIYLKIAYSFRICYLSFLLPLQVQNPHAFVFLLLNHPLVNLHLKVRLLLADRNSADQEGGFHIEVLAFVGHGVCLFFILVECCQNFTLGFFKPRVDHDGLVFSAIQNLQ